MLRIARTWLLWFGALNLLWLVFISAWVLEEEALGLLASGVAATAAAAVAEQRLLEFRPRPAWLLEALKLPLRSVRESLAVLGGLAGQVRHPGRRRGRFRVVRVTLPRGAGPEATKRALLVAGESFAPDSYVVEIDRRRRLMLVHELTGSRGR
jgi:hypothetical protein